MQNINKNFPLLVFFQLDLLQIIFVPNISCKHGIGKLMCYPFCSRMCSTLLPDDDLLSHPGKTLKRVPVKLQRGMGLDTSSISHPRKTLKRIPVKLQREMGLEASSINHPGKTLKRIPVILQREMGLDTSFISTSDSFTIV